MAARPAHVVASASRREILADKMPCRPPARVRCGQAAAAAILVGGSVHAQSTKLDRPDGARRAQRARHSRGRRRGARRLDASRRPDCESGDQHGRRCRLDRRARCSRSSRRSSPRFSRSASRERSSSSRAPPTGAFAPEARASEVPEGTRVLFSGSSADSRAIAFRTGTTRPASFWARSDAPRAELRSLYGCWRIQRDGKGYRTTVDSLMVPAA